MTKSEPPGRFTGAGMARALSPEAIATVLVVVLAVGGVFVVATGSADGGSPASPVPSSAPSLALPSVGIKTAEPTTAATAEPTASAITTSWAALARAVIAADERLILRREEISAELARKPRRSDDLARLLRGTSPVIQLALGEVEGLAATSAPPALVDRFLTAHETARDAARRTLAVTVQDVAAYKAGATEIVTALATLESLMRELATAAGLPDPLPDLPASPAPGASGQASPSAAP